MHAVTNTQSKKGNGLGMANVMYDKRFFLVFSFYYMLFFSCRVFSTNFLITLLYRIWTALVFAFLKDTE